MKTLIHTVQSGAWDIYMTVLCILIYMNINIFVCTYLLSVPHFYCNLRVDVFIFNLNLTLIYLQILQLLKELLFCISCFVQNACTVCTVVHSSLHSVKLSLSTAWDTYKFLSQCWSVCLLECPILNSYITRSFTQLHIRFIL